MKFEELYTSESPQSHLRVTSESPQSHLRGQFRKHHNFDKNYAPDIKLKNGIPTFSFSIQRQQRLIVKFNFASLFKQSLMLTFWQIVVGIFASEEALIWGTLAYGIHAYALRRILLRDYFIAQRHQRQKAWLLANRHLKKALDFLRRHAWIDSSRAFTLLNSSKISYTENILWMMSQNYLECGENEKAEAILQELSAEYPENRMAAQGRALVNLLKEVETQESKLSQNASKGSRL